jgi:hypothetical protein
MAQLGERRRVEGAGQHAPMAQRGNPLDHLARGLVGERHEQDLIGRDRAGFDRVRRPPADDSRLARARAGEDRERPGRCGDGLALREVEVFEQSFRGGRGGQQIQPRGGASLWR